MNYISKNFLDTNNDLTLLFSTRPDLEFFTTVEPFDPNEEALFPDLSNSPASSDMSNSTIESTSTPSNHHENRLDFFQLFLHVSKHGLRTPREEIAFTARPKIHSHSQIFSYGGSIFCLPHRPIFQISLIYAFIGCP